MLIIYFLVLIFKTFKFVEGGVINTNGFKYDPPPHLISKGQSKDASSARIISDDPFIISLETKAKEIEPNRRKKIAKKRNRMAREIQKPMDKLERSKRCLHHHHLRRHLQSKNDLPPLKKNTNSDTEVFNPEIVTKPLDLSETYDRNANYTPECVIQIADDQTLNDLIEEIRILKQKLKELLVSVANGTASSESITAEVESGEEDKKKLYNATATIPPLIEVKDESLGSEEKHEDLKDPEDQRELGGDDGNSESSDQNDLVEQVGNDDNEDVTDELFVDDKAILRKKINYLSNLIDKPIKGIKHEKIPDDVLQKWKDSPLLDLLYIPEKRRYEYRLREDSEEKKDQYDDQNLINNKIKYLQKALESNEITKSRRKRDVQESPCKTKERRCARDRVASSLNKKRYKMKKWADDLKLQRAQSKSKCKCNECNKKEKSEEDSFQMSDEILGDFKSNEKLLRWTKKSADKDPFMDDLEVYRERAKEILKNAQEILRRIKETEEKLKTDEDYLESDWGGGGYSTDKNTKVSDQDMEDLVLQLVKKVGKRLKEKRKRLEHSSEEIVDSEDEEAENDDVNEDSSPELSELENIVSRKTEETQKPKSEILEKIQDLVETTEEPSATTSSPFLNILKGTDVMRDKSTEDKSNTEPESPEPTDTPEQVKIPIDNLQSSKSDPNSTDIAESKKLPEKLQSSKLDTTDSKESIKSPKNHQSSKSGSKPTDTKEPIKLSKNLQSSKLAPTNTKESNKSPKNHQSSKSGSKPTDTKEPITLSKNLQSSKLAPTDTKEPIKSPENLQSSKSSPTSTDTAKPIKLPLDNENLQSSISDPIGTPEPIQLPDNLPLDNENLEASKLGLNSTDSIEKLMDDFQDGKLDNRDMKTIQNLDDKKLDNLIDKIDDEEEVEEEEEEDCGEPSNECPRTCSCDDKSEEVDKYEIMKSFLLWIKEMHLYNTLDNYPKLQQNK